MNVQQTIELWLEEVNIAKAKKTYLCYSDCYRRIKNFEEMHCLISDINTWQLQKILFTLNGYAKSTIHNTRIVLNQTMNFAYKNGFIKYNLTSSLELPYNAPTKTVEALTISEQEKIERVAENDMLGHIVIFLLRTGL